MTALRLLTVLLTVLSVACVATPPRASMADRDPLRRAVVTDVVEGLSEVFDPASTALRPARPMTGAFDTALLAALRAQGFSIEATEGHGETFDCSVEPLEGTLYRVTARVGKTTLSRLWVLNGENAYVGGAWARRE
jgi:hypothetical protein